MGNTFRNLLLVSALSFSSISFATCNLEEGDDYATSGKYLWADSCKVYGTVEAVNKKCTKAKVRVGKVTGAFGMRINDACRFHGAKAGAGDIVWVPIK